MKSVALFPSNTKSQNCRHLYQFKAGKLLLKEDKSVYPDERKGWAYFYQSDKSKIHFCWIDRKSFVVEDNFVVDNKFTFEKVTQSNSGRVYVLKKNKRKFFLWLQEPDQTHDPIIAEKVNELLSANAANLSHYAGFSDILENDIFSMISDRMNKKGNSSTSKGPSLAQSKIKLEDLRNIISSVASNSSTLGFNKNLDSITSTQTFKSFAERMKDEKKLKEFLPTFSCEEETVNAEFSRVNSHLNSQYFRAALSMFNSALKSGSAANLLQQFQFGPKVVQSANNGNILEFAEALEEEMSNDKQDDSNKMDTN